jgi:hypothetical protein
MILPFEACLDSLKKRKKGELPTSSFARWVERFWRLKGRTDADDSPELFELVFIALYSRDGSELGFYEVGASVECPRIGRPPALLTFDQFIERIRQTYYKRNNRDFHFAGEEPTNTTLDDLIDESV